MRKILFSAFVISALLITVTTATGAYFSSSVSISNNNFSTGIWKHLIINEVYYDVATDKGVEPDDEWIELYNPTPRAVDLLGWKIVDNSGYERVIGAGTIAPFGFALISKGISTWSYWSVPALVPKIALGFSIGNGLSNDGDRLILKNSGGIVDQMSYGTDNSILNPACLDVAKGHSLERNPAGKDTDSFLDFVDRTIPTPGG